MNDKKAELDKIMNQVIDNQLLFGTGIIQVNSRGIKSIPIEKFYRKRKKRKENKE